jgi:hypothetical protein
MKTYAKVDELIFMIKGNEGKVSPDAKVDDIVFISLNGSYPV